MKEFWHCVLATAVGSLCAFHARAAQPHHEQLAPGVHAVGFADRYGSANCGFVELADSTLLVDLPRGIDAGEFLAEVAKTTGKPATSLVLTHAGPDDVPPIENLRSRGIQRVYLSPATHKNLTSAPGKAATAGNGFELIHEKTTLGDAPIQVEVRPLDAFSSAGGAVVYLPGQKVLFGGPLVYHGPRIPLAGTNTEAWTARLRELAKLRPARVVPGFGSWGGADLLTRHERFLRELRRQVGYLIAQGRPHDDLAAEVRLGADYLVWMPYDTPLAEDVEHVYQELTVPQAPFRFQPPHADDRRAHALVLIGDLPHEPGHIEEGLRGVFESTGVVPHFTVDVRALSAENLARVPLLVILRDGLQRPKTNEKADYEWMTPDQQTAVVDFVHRGGGFLNLHNSMGLYPKDGPYLNLVGGRYIGHGPLERFRVEVVDRAHPVTRGVEDFSVADEQHTPPYDAKKVHLLLRNRSDEGQTAAAGWVYEPGKGRLCHLANGHTRESLLHPMYQRLMSNAVLWCLRKDVPAAENRNR